MSDPITFFVDGIPKGQPRPKAFFRGGKAAVYDPGTAEGWKGCVALAAQSKRPQQPLQGPLGLSLRFQFPRPKHHFRTGKKSDQLRDIVPYFHTGKPDVDNLAKAVMDAMTQLGFWGDDSQVSEITITKRFHNLQPGCEVTLHQLPDP